MNHAEHDESIGSMLASIAAALREVSDKLDVVAARVQQEVPSFPADDDLPDQTRIRRLETWAFHASQDISRLSARLDALDGGDPEPAPRARGTRSRREVREAAEAAARAAADSGAGEELSSPNPAGDRPPLERRHSRTDHLGDPTWPLTVAPIPRPSTAVEPGSEPTGEAAQFADTARSARSGRAEGHAAGGSASAGGSAVGTLADGTAESGGPTPPVNGTDRALPVNGRDRVPPVNGRASVNGTSRAISTKPLNGVRVVDDSESRRDLPARGETAADERGRGARRLAAEGAAPLVGAPQADAPQAGARQADAPQAGSRQAGAHQADAPQAGSRQADVPQAGAPLADAPQAGAEGVRGGVEPTVAAHGAAAEMSVRGTGHAGGGPEYSTGVAGASVPDWQTEAQAGQQIIAPSASQAGEPTSATARRHADSPPGGQLPVRSTTSDQPNDGGGSVVGPDRQVDRFTSASTAAPRPDDAGTAPRPADDVVPTESARRWADRLAAAAADQQGGDVVPTAAARAWADRLAAAAQQQTDDVVPTATAREWADRLAAAAELDALAAAAGRSDAAATAERTGVAARLGSVNGRAVELSDDTVIEAVERPGTQRLPHNGASRGGEAGGSGRDAEIGGRTVSMSALGREGASPEADLPGGNATGTSALSAEVAARRGESVAGAADELTVPGRTALGEAARGGDRVIDGAHASQANAAAVDMVSDPPTETGVRPPAETGVERARPVGKPTGATTAPGVGAGPAAGSSEALSGNRIDATADNLERVVSDPRSAGLTAGDRGETAGASPVDGFDPRSATSPETAASGTTTSGIHWTFTDEDLTTPSAPSPNGYARNGFTGGDSQRPGSMFDEVPRERLTSSGDTPPPPPARLSVPKDPGPAGQSTGSAGHAASAADRASASLEPTTRFGASTSDHGNAGLEPTTRFGSSTSDYDNAGLEPATRFGGSTSDRGTEGLEPAGGSGSESARAGGFAAANARGPEAPATSPLDRVASDPAPPTATDAAGITVTGTFRAFDIERAHVDKLQAMLDELKRSSGLPPGRSDVFGPPTTEPG